MAGYYKLNIIRGDTFTKTLTWMDSTGTPYNIAGWTAHMQFRDSPDGAVTHNFDGSYFTINGVDGEIIMTIPASETAAFDWTEKVYDLQLTNPNVTPNFVKTLLGGSVQCSKDVTHA